MKINYPILLNTNFNHLKLFQRGKVRDLYDLGENILIVATDRISAFDFVLSDGIPNKGAVLNQISKFWFKSTENIIPNHFITDDVEKYPEICHPYKEIIKKRSMLVKKSNPLPVECVVRGYLAGSGWKEYQQKGLIGDVKLPAGLKESSQLPEPIFTPTTKAAIGTHDENITFAEVVKLIGTDIANKIKEKSIEIYNWAVKIAEERGIIIADTKFEFGLLNNQVILIDEVLTPDSSRFWPKDDYEEGRSQKSFDKQIVRDYLISINWEKCHPRSKLPEEIIKKTSEKYMEAYKKLTLKDLENESGD